MNSVTLYGLVRLSLRDNGFWYTYLSRRGGEAVRFQAVSGGAGPGKRERWKMRSGDTSCDVICVVSHAFFYLSERFVGDVGDRQGT